MLYIIINNIISIINYVTQSYITENEIRINKSIKIK